MTDFKTHTSVVGPAKDGILTFQDRSQIPDSAVLLTDLEVENLQWHAINKLKSTTNMWPFVHGSSVLGVFAGGTGLAFNQIFRKAFRLRHYGRIATALPAVMIPAVTTALCSYSYVGRKILLGEFSCSSCANMRSAAIQSAFGFFQPLLMAPIAAAIIAKQTFSIALPPLVDFRENIVVVRKVLKPYTNTLLGLLLVQIMVGVVVSHKQQISFYQLIDHHRQGNMSDS